MTGWANLEGLWDWRDWPGRTIILEGIESTLTCYRDVGNGLSVRVGEWFTFCENIDQGEHQVISCLAWDRSLVWWGRSVLIRSRHLMTLHVSATSDVSVYYPLASHHRIDGVMTLILEMSSNLSSSVVERESNFRCSLIHSAKVFDWRNQ